MLNKVDEYCKTFEPFELLYASSKNKTKIKQNYRISSRERFNQPDKKNDFKVAKILFSAVKLYEIYAVLSISFLSLAKMIKPNDALETLFIMQTSEYLVPLTIIGM